MGSIIDDLKKDKFDDNVYNVIISSIRKLNYRFQFDYHTMKDVVQEVALKLLSWKDRLTLINNESSLRSWIDIVGKNECIRILKERGREIPSDTVEDKPDEAELIEIGFLNKMLREAFDDCVEKLPPEQRETIRLILKFDYNNVEAASVLGVAASTIKRRRDNAIKGIMICLNKKGLDAEVM